MSHGTTALLLVGVAALAVTVGTGGYTTTSAERGVTVAVADDEDAMLGVDQTAETANGTANLTVTVTNQFATDATLSTVTVRVGDRSADVAPPGGLGPGEEASATFEGVDCGATVEIEADGDGADVRLTRPVSCE